MSDHPQRALITGGAGFIGSHLADELLRRGHRVEVLDDLSTGRTRNVAHLLGRPDFGFTYGSVLDRDRVAELVARADVVFHLAAVVGVRRVVGRSVETLETNIRGTEHVLEACTRRCRRLVLTSSSEVYGRGNGEPFRESHDAVLGLGLGSAGRWCYAASKMVDELLAQAYARERGLRVAVARLFNTIGPRQTGRYGMVVPRFVEQAIAGAPITVYGDGSQRRSFTWVGDVVDALIGLAGHVQRPGAARTAGSAAANGADGDAAAEGQAADDAIFNVGHTEETSILDLARTVRELTASESPMVFVPLERAYGRGFEDPPRRLPDISKLRRAIGYQPTLGLREMLGRILAHHRDEAARQPRGGVAAS